MSLSAGTRWAFVPVAAALLTSCGDKPPTELTQPAKLLISSGNQQSVTNGPADATDPLIVQVLDPRNRGVKDVTVNWATPDAGGSLSSATSTTDGNGYSQVTWTMGSSAGPQTVKATTPSINGAEVVFTGTNNVIGITGAVSISSSLPVAFGVSASSRTALRASVAAPSPGAMVYDPMQVKLALSRGAAASRRLIVQFKSTSVGVAGRAALRGADIDRSLTTMKSAMAPLVSARRLTKTELSPSILTSRVTVAPDVPMADAIKTLRAMANVQSVTTDQILPLLEPYAAKPVTRNQKQGASVDAARTSSVVGTLPVEQILYPTLWHYNMIEAPRAWTTQKGSANVLVAVVDNGIRFDHPAMATCSSFSSCTAGNLSTDGYNFVTAGARLDTAEALCAGGTTTITEPGYGPDPTAWDDLFFNGTCWDRSTVGNHGLHVAGTIGARGNDGLGTTGINWTVKIRPVRVLDVTGSGSYFDVAQGILYAAGLPASDGNGGTVTAPSAAPIINMSLGGVGPNTTLESAVIAATNAGSLIIVSAGNAEADYYGFIPAGYPQVLAVSAVGPDYQLATYSNIGSNVSLAAPGGDWRYLYDLPGSLDYSTGVASTTWDFVNNQPSYAFYEGTSMAAPHVTGVAALVLAANPTFNNTQLRSRLQSTALHIGAPGRDQRWGWGIVNAYQAVNNITSRAANTYVHVISTTTGDTVKRVAVNADGSFEALRLAAGSYWVVAGQDDAGDGKIGRPGRRFGWFGPAGGPTSMAISGTQSGVAAINVGTPLESNGNATGGSPDRVVVDGWIMGRLWDAPIATFLVQIPRAATYTFTLDALVGACGYGLELDGVLTLQQADGTQLDQNDDVDVVGGNYCSKITRSMTPGSYKLVVSGYGDYARGQFALHVRQGS